MPLSRALHNISRERQQVIKDDHVLMLRSQRLRPMPRTATPVLTKESPIELCRKIWSLSLSRIYLRQCSSVGRSTYVHGRPRISNEGRLAIGQHVSMLSTVVPIELLVFPGAVLEIGNHTFINYGSSLAATGSIHIGQHCLLGMHSIIFDNNFHEFADRHQRPAAQPVVLEDNVWLGHRTTILPGVTIGHDSVIGAGSVVTSSIPARVIAAGNPARVIRTL